jgi:hypothetical protein
MSGWAESRRTQKQHLDLIALLHAIPLKLVLDLLVPDLALLLLRAHAATHLGGLLKEKITIRECMVGRVRVLRWF